jgi:hypothetical protein
MKRHAHRVGAVFYVLWGTVHIYVGALMLSRLAAEGGPESWP